jgi:hypothetical protein
VTSVPSRIRIRSGGQTGVDRAALDFALARGIEIAGWCPLGGWAEDVTEPPGILGRYPQLRATPSADSTQRTEWNVRDSDATLVLAPGGTLAASPGSEWTRECAERRFAKPFLLVDPDATDGPERAAAWLRQVRDAGRERVFDLNVAGPRESGAPGVYARTLEFMAALWSLLDDGPPAGRNSTATGA